MKIVSKAEVPPITIEFTYEDSLKLAREIFDSPFFTGPITELYGLLRKDDYVSYDDVVDRTEEEE